MRENLLISRWQLLYRPLPRMHAGQSSRQQQVPRAPIPLAAPLTHRQGLVPPAESPQRFSQLHQHNMDCEPVAAS